MRFPEFLKSDGTIGFVAPSFGCAIEPYSVSFDNAIKKFEDLGYSCNLGPNCRLDLGVGISNTPFECADELMEAYISQESDVLISCGGGELMCEILEYMDFDKIASAKPKWYMGYSDNTNFTFLSATLADTAAIYAPCAASFGMDEWHESLTDAFEMLKGNRLTVSDYGYWQPDEMKNRDDALGGYNCTEKTVVRAYVPSDVCESASSKDNANRDTSILEQTTKKVEIEGRLLGGCLDCLDTLVGTSFDRVKEFNEKYKEDGIIWFLEACDLNVFSMRRAMWQLEHAGWFDQVEGFIIGRPLMYGQDMMGLNHYDAFLKICEKHNVPVIMDADVGHLSPMMPLICGAYATVTAEDGGLSIEMELR